MREVHGHAAVMSTEMTEARQRLPESFNLLTFAFFLPVHQMCYGVGPWYLCSRDTEAQAFKRFEARHQRRILSASPMMAPRVLQMVLGPSKRRRKCRYRQLLQNNVPESDTL